MGTQMRNINIRSQGRLQDTHSLLGLNLGSVYKQRNFAHIFVKLPYLEFLRQGALRPGQRFSLVIVSHHSCTFNRFFTIFFPKTVAFSQWSPWDA